MAKRVKKQAVVLTRDEYLALELAAVIKDKDIDGGWTLPTMYGIHRIRFWRLRDHKMVEQSTEPRSGNEYMFRLTPTGRRYLNANPKPVRGQNGEAAPSDGGASR